MAEESNAMYYSVEQLQNLSLDLLAQTNEFKEIIDTMYDDIYGMETQNYWRGATYTQFKEMCDKFKNDKINNIIEKLNGWSQGFANIADTASETTEKNKKVFDTL